MATRAQALIPITIAAAIVGVVGLDAIPNDAKLESVAFPRDIVTLDEKLLDVQIADNDPRRVRGLMFQEDLEYHEGMLFIFETEGIHSRWMLNIQFPLDMIWFDSDGRVVHIEENVQPCTSALETRSCTEINDENTSALYVLDLVAGYVQKFEVTTDSVLVIDSNDTKLESIDFPRGIIALDGKFLEVQIADDHPRRVQGLMFQEGLEYNEGMIFKFENKGVHSLWMRNMQFPLDMIWFDSDGHVVHIEENVPPCKTALDTRSCIPVNNGDTLALYVLELAAGYVQKFKITTDSVLAIDPNDTKLESVDFPRGTIALDGKFIEVQIADDTPQHMRGLMFQEGLEYDEGMIFKFENEGVHSLWMLNMQFPLDMIWFDSNGRVVHIEENVQPCKTAFEKRSCTPVRNGDTLALYVLELADGYVQKFKVTSDSVLEIISI